MPKYTVTWTVTAEVEIADPDALARTQTDEWRSLMYDLNPAQAVAMLAWQVSVNDVDVDMLDGWADMPRSAVVGARVERSITDVVGPEGRLDVYA